MNYGSAFLPAQFQGKRISNEGYLPIRSMGSFSHMSSPSYARQGSGTARYIKRVAERTRCIRSEAWSGRFVRPSVPDGPAG